MLNSIAEKKETSVQPVIRHIANLWTLMGHPSALHEWSLNQKLEAIRDAGFDGVCWAPSDALREGARRFGLLYVGGMAPNEKASLSGLLQDVKQCGARDVNVQLAAHDTDPATALRLTLTLIQEAKHLGLQAAIETHRGTCTETPEKTYALADAYLQATGELLPLSWDFSHFAVVKHLVPEQFIDRLLRSSILIQHARQFHFRPFNGHHVQVPILTPDDGLTREVMEWIPFAEAVMRCWLDGDDGTGREILVCPELGPLEGGYALSNFKNSWEEAKRLRVELARLWLRVTGESEHVVPEPAR